MKNEEHLIENWISEKKKIFVYTVTKRLNGIITKSDEDNIILDDRTIVYKQNIISISDVADRDVVNK